MMPLEALQRERDRVLDGLGGDPLAGAMRVALYGAGFLGTWAVRWLRQNGVEPVACFDGNAQRQGSDLLGVPILAPEALAELAPDLVFITARHAVAAVADIVRAHGVAGCALDAFFAARNLNDFLDVHDRLLADDRSRDTLRGVLAAMLTGTCSPLHDVCEKDQYFCLPRFAGGDVETYVNAGAYVGDSLERFIWANAGAFARIHAFEPAERQFAALERRVARLTAEWALDADAIMLNRVALSDAAARLSGATASGQLQSVSLAAAEDGAIPALTLDAYLDGADATFIKADVEGMEMALLRGAAGTIARCRPKLAISVYHYPSDIPEISAFISGIVPDYRFALRHHAPRLLETVLYCWTD